MEQRTSDRGEPLKQLETEVIYAFDSYTLDGDKRELREGQLVVQLQPRVFDLLEFLLRNRDRVVSKDEMLAAVWGGRIVSEIDARQPDQCRARRDRRQRRRSTADPYLLA